MTKSKKIYFIVLEFVFAVVFGFLGGYLFLRFGNEGHLYSVRFSYIAMYLSSFLGIGIAGYFYLKENQKLPVFLTSLLLGFFGLVTFYIILRLTVVLLINRAIISRATPTYLSFVLLLLPMAGAILGFNYKTSNIFRNDVPIKV